MNTSKYKFDLPQQSGSIIKVIGVGGGGSNAVNHMYNQGIKDVEFIVCNTDAQSLQASPVKIKLQIGESGLGAGANPEKGRGAAVESKEEIRQIFGNDTKMIFITAGMGGGTGTGAAPEIAKVARELDILTVGIVTMPFAFEGRQKAIRADAGVKTLKEYCDTVLVILNDKLREVFPNLSMSNAFAQADNILTTAAKSIAEIITVPGYINVDFEDVRTVMAGSGAAVMGSAKAEGDHRARRAAEEALSSPLLNNKNITGAEKILLSIRSGIDKELSMEELDEITEFIQQKAGDNAEVIFGHGIDETLGGSVSVTVIATGFEHDGMMEEKPAPQKKVYDLESNKVVKKEEEPVRREQHENITPPIRYGNPDKNVPFEKEDDASDREDENNRVVHFNLDDNYQVSDNDRSNPPQPSDDMNNKREELKRAARERVRMLKENKGNSNFPYDEDESYRDKLEMPAYKRRNIRLLKFLPSDEHHISRYTLDGENSLTTKNRYLHDNAD